MYGSGLGMAGGMSPGRSSLMPPGMGITRPSLQQIQMQQMLMMQQHVYGEGLEFGRHMPLAAQSGGPGGTMMMVQAPNGQPQCVMIPNLGSGLGGGPLGASLGSMTPHGSMYPPVMSMVPGQYNLGQASAPGQCRWGQQQQRQQLTVPAGSGSNSQLRMMQRIDAAALPIATSTAATVSADVKLEYESPLTSTSMDRHSTITTTETASPIGNPKLAVQHQHAAAAGGFPFIASGEPYSGPNSKGVMTAGADRGGHDSTTANTIMPQIPALKRKQPVSWKVAQDSAAKPRKTKRFRPMPAEEWHKAIQVGGGLFVLHTNSRAMPFTPCVAEHGCQTLCYSGLMWLFVATSTTAQPTHDAPSPSSSRRNLSPRTRASSPSTASSSGATRTSETRFSDGSPQGSPQMSRENQVPPARVSSSSVRARPPSPRSRSRLPAPGCWRKSRFTSRTTAFSPRTRELGRCSSHACTRTSRGGVSNRRTSSSVTATTFRLTYRSTQSHRRPRQSTSLGAARPRLRLRCSATTTWTKYAVRVFVYPRL